MEHRRSIPRTTYLTYLSILSMALVRFRCPRTRSPDFTDTEITSLFIRTLAIRFIDRGRSERRILTLVSSILGTNRERETGNGPCADSSFLRGGQKGADRFGFHGGRFVRQRRCRIRHATGSVCQTGPGSDLGGISKEVAICYRWR